MAISIEISTDELAFIHGYEERRARLGVEKRRLRTAAEKVGVQVKLDEVERRYRELDMLLDQHSEIP